MVGTYQGTWPEDQGEGRHQQGGYGLFHRTRGKFAVPVPDGLDSFIAAPMMCGGVTGAHLGKFDTTDLQSLLAAQAPRRGPWQEGRDRRHRCVTCWLVTKADFSQEVSASAFSPPSRFADASASVSSSRCAHCPSSADLTSLQKALGAETYAISHSDSKKKDCVEKLGLDEANFIIRSVVELRY